MGVNDWWLLSVTAGLDQPLGENLQGDAIEIETSSNCSSAMATGSLSPSKPDMTGVKSRRSS